MWRRWRWKRRWWLCGIVCVRVCKCENYFFFFLHILSTLLKSFSCAFAHAFLRCCLRVERLSSIKFRPGSAFCRKTFARNLTEEKFFLFSRPGKTENNFTTNFSSSLCLFGSVFGRFLLRLSSLEKRSNTHNSAMFYWMCLCTSNNKITYISWIREEIRSEGEKKRRVAQLSEWISQR